MEYLVIAMLLGLIPAFIARSKGRPMLGWWIYGTLLWIIALIHVLCVGDLNQEKAQKAAQREAETMRECPHCAELIKKKAAKCKHCHEAVTPIAPEEEAPLPKTWEEIKAQHGVKSPDVKGTAKAVGSTTLYIVGAIALALGAMIAFGYLQKSIS